MEPDRKEPLKDDHGHFMRLYMSHEVKIRGYILCLVNGWADAEDILQDTVMIMWRKFDTFDSQEAFLPWALRIAHFEVLNYYRKQKSGTQVFKEALLTEIEAQTRSALDNQDRRRDALERCIRKMSERDQTLLRLRYEVGATARTVAETVERSVDAVYKALNRIHQQLLVCIRRTLARESY